MNAMRYLFKSRSGFTLVELMVVVVVLGILAGIAVQRMGDVRDRAETAAREANTRLLLGAANLAKTRNYGDYMYTNTNPGSPAINGDYNSTIRWMRPCDGPPVTQHLGHLSTSVNHYLSGYNTFAGYPFGIAERWSPPDHYNHWRHNQEWNLTDYLESFPVGYAVEIVFRARHPQTGNPIDHPDGNSTAYVYGYHQDRGAPGNNPYDVDTIYIYKFVGTETTESKDWDPLQPGPGTGPGTDYPYHGETTGSDSTDPLEPDDWELIFPAAN